MPHYLESAVRYATLFRTSSAVCHTAQSTDSSLSTCSCEHLLRRVGLEDSVEAECMYVGGGPDCHLAIVGGEFTHSAPAPRIQHTLHPHHEFTYSAPAPRIHTLHPHHEFKHTLHPHHELTHSAPAPRIFTHSAPVPRTHILCTRTTNSHTLHPHHGEAKS